MKHPMETQTQAARGRPAPTIGARKIVIVVCAALAISVPAFVTTAVAPAASDPTAAQYSDGTGTDGVASGSADGAGTDGVASGAQSPTASGLDAPVAGLPFTGLDMISLVAISMALMGMGFVLHRLSRPRPRA